MSIEIKHAFEGAFDEHGERIIREHSLPFSFDMTNRDRNLISLINFNGIFYIYWFYC